MAKNKYQVSVINKVGPNDPRTYEVSFKKNGAIKVRIKKQIRPNAGPFVGMIDYEEKKIIFEDTINPQTLLSTYDVFKELEKVRIFVSAALTADASYLYVKKYQDWTIQVYFLDGKKDDYLGSITYGTPKGNIDRNAYALEFIEEDEMPEIEKPKPTPKNKKDAI